jgi:hypothetical protein
MQKETVFVHFLISQHTSVRLFHCGEFLTMTGEGLTEALRKQG